MYNGAGSMYQGKIPKAKIITQKIDTARVTKIQEEKNENPIIQDTSYMLQEKSQQASLFSSNYFWLALSVSVGLLAGVVVLALRTMVLF